jgi:hypothetical protein
LSNIQVWYLKGRIELKVGGEVSGDYVQNLFKRHNWRKKVPRGSYPKSNEGRAIVGKQLIREVYPKTDESFSLILPYASEDCMNVSMGLVSKEFKQYRIIIMEATWHRRSHFSTFNF